MVPKRSAQLGYDALNLLVDERTKTRIALYLREKSGVSWMSFRRPLSQIGAAFILGSEIVDRRSKC